MIEKGLQAPDFHLQDQKNQWIELKAFLGTKVCILFFSSITNLDNQAFIISYAKMADHFSELNVHIIAVCGDSIDILKKESKRLHIPFSLLSDPNQAVRKRYDVWNQKITFGKPHWITSRSSLLINEHGVIYRTYKRAHIEVNVIEVLSFLRRDYEKSEWRKLSRRTKERIKREQAQRQEMMVSDSENGFGNDDLIEFIEAFQITIKKKTKD